MFISQALAATQETADSGGGAFPPFDPTYFASQILWLVITFGLFYMIMSRVVIPRLAGILEVRRDRISRDLDETQRLKAEADAAHAAYEHELAEAKRNAHSIALDATDKAKAEANEAREKVEAELAEKMAEAEAHIAGIKQKALGEVGTIASDTTKEIVTQLIGGKLTKAEVSKAVSAAEGK
ncbi:MAG: F0F1 ATP synthase subunit B [Pseudomonadota bacterium]